MLIFPKIDFTGVQCLLTDIDNTLYDYDVCNFHALDKVHDYFKSKGWFSSNIDAFRKEYRYYRDQTYTKLKPLASCRSRLLSFIDWMQVKGESYTQALILDQLYWDSFIDNMVVNLEAYRTIKQAHDRGIKIIAVSDMTAEVQIRKLQRLGLDHYIHSLITSEQIGAEKPDPKMFLEALSIYNFKPSEAIFIGDSLEKDIQGAQNVGIQRTYQVTFS